MTVFVGNLDYGATERDIHRLFSDPFTPAKVHVPRGEEASRNKGIAFVTLKDQSREHEAIRILDGSEVKGRSVRLEIAKRDSKVHF